MAIKISEYAPVVTPLFPRPDFEDEDWKCPYPGMEDVWVKIIPPSWSVERERQQFVNGWHNDPRLSVYDISQLEIALTYGGSNMVVLVMKRDENGRPIFTEEDPGYEYETVKFDANGQLDKEQVIDRLSKLPSDIVIEWHRRVKEVATDWVTSFRS